MRCRNPLAPIVAGVVLLALRGAAATEPLRVGMELAYPPFEMTDREGKPAGVSVRLAESLGEHLGRAVVIDNIAFDGLIPALKSGRIDCIISSMTATPERARSIAFSEPYLETGLALLVGAGSTLDSADAMDAPGRVIVVKQGTTGHQYATATLRRARVLVIDAEAAAVLEVLQGRADAFIYDALSVYATHRRHPVATRALLRPFRRESWAVGLRLGDDALRAQVNGFLAEFRRTGGFERLGDEYLAEPKAFFASQGIPFLF